MTELTGTFTDLPGLQPDADRSYNPTLASLDGMTGLETDEPQEKAVLTHQMVSHLRRSSTMAAGTEPEQEFSLWRELARGGMGEVWEGRQAALVRTVALKRIRMDRFGAEDTAAHYQQAFYLEAVITANLTHPNIVPIYDLGTDSDGSMLLAMKLVKGTSWSRLLGTEVSTLPPDDYLRRHLTILLEVTQAVAYAHSRGILHRDLKPGQVMVGEFGEVQLMDWGLALAFDRQLVSDQMPALTEIRDLPNLENSSNPAGTPAYMAPEQTDRDCRRIGPHTDVFLLGAMLYRILTGHAPYGGVEAGAAMAKAQAGMWYSARKRAPDRWIPPELDALAKWAMQKDPGNRMATVRQFMQSLEDHLEHSGRRWESRQFTMDVARRIDNPSITMQDLAACESQLGRAEGLWPQNPEIGSLRQIVVAAYASLAATGDEKTTRAVLMARRVEDQPFRVYLIELLERAYATGKRKKWLLFDLGSAILTGFLVLIVIQIVRKLM